MIRGVGYLKLTPAALLSALLIGHSAAIAQIEPRFAAPSMRAAADEEHLWITLLDHKGGHTLMHRRFADKADENTIFLLPDKRRGRPVALASYDGVLYTAVLHEDRVVVESTTYRPPVVPNQSPYSIGLLPKLPDHWRVLGLVAGRSGAMVLLGAPVRGPAPIGEESATPDPPADVPDDAPAPPAETPASADPVPVGPYQLLQHTKGRWEPIELPADLPPDAVDANARITATAVVRLAMVDPRQDGVTLIVRPAADAPVTVHQRQGGQWVTHRYDIRLSPDFAAAGVGTTLVVADPASSPRDAKRAFNFTLLRLGSAHSLGAAVADPESAPGPWTLLGMGDHRLALILSDGQSKLYWARGDLSQPPDTLLEAAELKSAAPPKPQQDLSTLLIIAAVAVALLFLFATSRRAAATSEPKLPKHLLPADLARRFAAGIIDLIPSAAVVLLIYGPDELSTLLSNSQSPPTEWAALIPEAISLGVFLFHTTLAELLTAKSLGKWMLGLEVVDLRGRRPGVYAVLIRNLLKVLDLLAPPLLVLPVLSVHHQRVGDIVAKTVVVSRHVPPKPADDSHDDNPEV